MSTESFMSIEIEDVDTEGDWKDCTYHIEDLDKPHPVLYLNGKKLIGHYEATDGTDLIITPQDNIQMSNKKLVFKLDIEHPNYETLSEVSSSIRSGNLNVPQSTDGQGAAV